MTTPPPPYNLMSLKFNEKCCYEVPGLGEGPQQQASLAGHLGGGVPAQQGGVI